MPKVFRKEVCTWWVVYKFTETNCLYMLAHLVRGMMRLIDQTMHVYICTSDSHQQDAWLDTENLKLSWACIRMEASTSSIYIYICLVKIFSRYHVIL